MREAMVSLAKERDQSQELHADAAERVRRMSVCLQDLRRASVRDWRPTDREQAASGSGGGDCSERRRSVLELVGHIDEGFTALSWSARAHCHLRIIYTSHSGPSGVQWRCKVGAGPCARIPKGPPLSHAGFVCPLPPQRWARVHCTPCTPYCYATGVFTP